jgi:plasmid stability protein
MATIQIRDIPEDSYEIIRERARTAGQSIQTYMREQVIDFTARRTSKETWDAIEADIQAENMPGSGREKIVQDVREARGD